jgi:hypothetical protein
VLVAVATLAIVAGLVLADGLWRWVYYDLRGYSVGPPSETWPMKRTVEPTDVRVAAVGDPGTGDAGEYAVTRVIAAEHDRRPYDAVTMLGDLIYPDGDVADFDGAIARPFEGLLDPPVEVLPALGNHDYESGDEDDILQRLGRSSPWYSAEVGGVLFVVLDSNRVDDAEQTAWLRDTLGSTPADWTIVALHHPPYSAGPHGSHDDVREAWSGLFSEYGVELVLAGHDHDYQRSEPVDGVVYVVSGGGGKTNPTGTEDFTEFAAGDILHYLDLQISDDELLGQAVDTDGRVFDSFTLEPSP